MTGVGLDSAGPGSQAGCPGEHSGKARAKS